MIGDFEQFRDGACSQRTEQEFLYGLIRAIQPEVCVETGTHTGLASIYIARALEDNNKGHLWTVDPIDWNQIETFESLSPNLQKYISFEQIRGDELKLDKEINFAFIDGFHGREDVIEEIDNIFPQLADHAIVIFHDCLEIEENWHQGVLRALEVKDILNKTVVIPSLNWMRIYEHRKNKRDRGNK